MNGKGSNPRPKNITEEEFENNWDKINWKKKKLKKKEKKNEPRKPKEEKFS